MKKCIFLDRDGTLNVEVNYLYKITDFKWEYKAKEAVEILKKLGYLLIVVTNQSGVARGKYQESDVNTLHDYMQKDLPQGIKIDGFYMCPHHETEGVGQYKIACECRKPSPGMLIQGIDDFNVDVKKSYMVGDKISDCIAGEQVGLTPVLVKTGHGSLDVDKINDKTYLFDSLYHFAIWLKSKEGM